MFTNQSKKGIYIFYHLEKTGGSSFWHSLVRALPRQDYVDDIYWRLVQESWDNEKLCPSIGSRSLYSDQKTKTKLELIKKSFEDINISDARIFIHHHIPISVSKYFHDFNVIATIRDPIEQFLSAIRHMRLRKDSLFFPDYNPESTIEETINEFEYFRNYYRFWFHCLLFENSIEKVIDLTSNANLASYEEILKKLRDIKLKVILARRGSFDQEELDSFSKNLLIGRLDCNNNRIAGTVTKHDLISRIELENFLKVANSLFKPEQIFIQNLLKLGQKI